MQRRISTRLGCIHIDSGIEEQADRFEITRQGQCSVERLVLLRIAGGGMDVGAAVEEKMNRFRTGKGSSQMQRRPAIAGEAVDGCGIRVEEGAKRRQVAEGGGFEEVEFGNAGAEKIAHRCLAGVDGPKQSGNTLNVAREGEFGVSFRFGGELGALAAADHVEDVSAHQADSAAYGRADFRLRKDGARKR